MANLLENENYKEVKFINKALHIYIRTKSTQANDIYI